EPGRGDVLRRASDRARRPARGDGPLMPYALAVLVLAAVTALVFVAMYRGWRRRARRLIVTELPALPAGSAPAEVPAIEGVYVASTLAGQPWERVSAHGLGVKSAVQIQVFTATDAATGGGGVLLTRRGARDVFIPAGQLRQVRRASGMIGKVVETDGLVILTWQAGDTLLDTGLRTRYAADRTVLFDRIHTLLSARGE